MNDEKQDKNQDETYFTIMTKSGLPIRLSSTQLKNLKERASQESQNNK